MIKKYLVFAGSSYYPEGGFHDFKDSFLTYEEALQYIAKLSDDWKDIVNLEDYGIINE